jgi:hypothetical protein
LTIHDLVHDYAARQPSRMLKKSEIL